MDSAVGTYSPIQLRVGPSLAARLSELARGRSIVVDYFASRRCAVTIGDLTVAFGSVADGSVYAELEPIGEVRVFAERDLLDLLARGAEVIYTGPAFARHLGLWIDQPERWLEFLEGHPGRR